MLSSQTGRGREPDIQPRLLSPDAAAAYLGLGSRWAIYRLISTGQLAAIKLASKVRIDVVDLDDLITILKQKPTSRVIGEGREVRSTIPERLASLPVARRRRRLVTASVTQRMDHC